MEWVKYVLESEIRRLNDCKKLSLKKLQNPQLEDTYVKHENDTIEDCDKKIKEVSNFINTKTYTHGEVLKFIDDNLIDFRKEAVNSKTLRQQEMNLDYCHAFSYLKALWKGTN